MVCVFISLLLSLLQDSDFPLMSKIIYKGYKFYSTMLFYDALIVGLNCPSKLKSHVLHAILPIPVVERRDSFLFQRH